MNPLVERFGWTLIHSLWEGTLAWVGLQLILVVLRRHSARLRYFAGCGALALAILAPWFTFSHLDAGIRDLPSLAAMTAAAPTPNRAIANPAGLAALGSHSWLSYLQRDLTAVMPWLVLVWTLGCAWASLRLIVGWRMARRLATAPYRPLPEPIRQRCVALATRLGIDRAVRLGESLLVEVPSVVGWLKPIILVPAGAFAGLSASQIDALLGHELAHVLRHDFLVNLLQSICDVVFFYHPAVLAINRSICVERENACDDIAVALTGDPAGYAAALAQLEEARGPALSLAVTGNGHLLGRVRRLLGHPRVKERATPTAAWFVFAGVGLYLAALMVSPTVLAQLSPNRTSGTEGLAVSAPVVTPGPKAGAIAAPPLRGAASAQRANPHGNFEAMAALQVARSTIVVTSNQVRDPSIRSEFDLETFQQVLRSEKLRRFVMASYTPAELEMLQRPYVDAGPDANIFGATTFEYDSANMVLYIFSRHPDPAAAALIANRYASQFGAYLLKNTVGASNYAVTYLQERAAQLLRDSETADKALENFNAAHPGSDTSAMNATATAQKESLQGEADRAKSNYQTILHRLAETKAINSKTRIPVTQIVVASAPKD